jgi:hypothetical protein
MVIALLVRLVALLGSVLIWYHFSIPKHAFCPKVVFLYIEYIVHLIATDEYKVIEILLFLSFQMHTRIFCSGMKIYGQKKQSSNSLLYFYLFIVNYFFVSELSLRIPD